MADPVSITTSVLTLLGATVTAAMVLCETVERYKDRHKTLVRIQREVLSLNQVLTHLEEAIFTLDASLLMLLSGPLEECNIICDGLKKTMENFGRKSRTGLIDWAKMEFRRSNINTVMENLERYKSTISVALGIATMRTAKLTNEVLKEYQDMIKDTVYDLELRVQRIEEDIASPDLNNTAGSDTSKALGDELEVTKQCLRVCEDAKLYLDSLQDREPSSPQNPFNTANNKQGQFEDSRIKNKVMRECSEKMAEAIGRIQERLASMSQEPERSLERLRLQGDLKRQKECLEVCRRASDGVAYQQITFGEIVADGESDLMVVTTMADLFDVKKAQSKNHSTLLAGSMTDEALMKISGYRFNSRYGAVTRQVGTRSTASPSGAHHGDISTPPHQPRKEEPRARKEGPRTRKEGPRTTKEGSQAGEDESQAGEEGPEAMARPASNTMKKRTSGGEYNTK